MRRFLGALLCLGCSIGQAHAAAFGFDAYSTINISGWGRAVAIGDVNGDGRNDLVVAKSPSDVAGPGEYKVYVFYQAIDGTLADPVIVPLPDEQNVNAMTLADLNRDGVQDIVLGHLTGITLLTTSRARPQFKRTEIDAGQGVTGVVTLDVDRDGATDIVAQGWGTVPMVYFGDGMGNVTRIRALPAGTEGESIESGDINNDGLPDLISSNATPGALVAIFHDAQDWFRATTATYDPGYPTDEIALGDFNHDGRQDIATRNTVSTVLSVFYQHPSGAPFTTASTYTVANVPSALLGEDLDGDGRDDLTIVHDNYHQLGYMLQGDAGLAAEVLVPITGGGVIDVHAVAAGDINGDGCKDLVLGDYSAGVVILTSHGCTIPADMAVSIGGDASTVNIALDNRSLSATIAAPLVTVQLKVNSGTLATGTLPAGCAVQAQTANSQRIQCLAGALAPQSATTLSIPVTIGGSGPRTWLSATVRATTDTPELALDNNAASIVLRPLTTGLRARR
jgi:hypothetical protein